MFLNMFCQQPTREPLKTIKIAIIAMARFAAILVWYRGVFFSLSLVGAFSVLSVTTLPSIELYLDVRIKNYQVSVSIPSHIYIHTSMYPCNYIHYKTYLCDSVVLIETCGTMGQVKKESRNSLNGLTHILASLL